MADLLAQLWRGIEIEEEVAVVAAHPDDEILGLGSRLGRLSRLKLIHLTDGAPRDLVDARRCGFTDCESYAARRESELCNALAAAGVERAERCSYGYPDQQAVEHLPEIVERLTHELAGVHAVVTHAYEHGHPDHDTAALAVALACGRLWNGSRRPPLRYEFAGYHLADDRPLQGCFWPDSRSPECRIRLSGEEVACKQAARACFETQAAIIASFPIAEERLRPAPPYRFREPAPPGAAVYDLFGWRMTSERWRALAAEAIELCSRDCRSWV